MTESNAVSVCLPLITKYNKKAGHARCIEKCSEQKCESLTEFMSEESAEEILAKHQDTVELSKKTKDQPGVLASLWHKWLNVFTKQPVFAREHLKTNDLKEFDPRVKKAIKQREWAFNQ